VRVPAPQSVSRRLRAITLYGRAMSRTTMIYAIGTAAVVPFGVLSVAVTTRYLSPADYGRLSILFVLAAGVTVLANLATLPGSTHWVYGVAEGAEADVEAGRDEVLAPMKEKREIMGTALILTLATCGAIAAVVMPMAEPIGRLLLREHGHADDVRWAVISGLTGAPWRMSQNVYRFERRAVAFSVISAVRPAVVVALTVLALSEGQGVDGVLAATALGTMISVSAALAGSWQNYRLHPRLHFAVEIYRRGKRYTLLALSAYAQANADVLALAQVASPRDVGLYRVATRIAQLPTYVSHAYLMAWQPLERSPVGQANRQLRGREGFAATIYLYFVILTLALLVVVTLGADALIRIAASSYSSAAVLVPFAAAAFSAQMIFYGAFRTTIFRARLTLFATLSICATVGYGVIGSQLVPALGSRGISIASVATTLVATTIILALNQRGEHPLPLSWRRLSTSVVVSAATVAAGTAVPLDGWPRALWTLCVLVSFPVALVVCGVVPRSLVRTAVDILAGVVPDLHRRRRLRSRVSRLSPEERRIVVELVGLRSPIADVAERERTTRDVALARMTRGLRKMFDGGAATPADHLIGGWLLLQATTIERDGGAIALEEHGADLLDLHELEATFRLVRGSRIVWRLRERRGGLTSRGH
jgi:O-antigen/teichoic acid export membrane protein